MSKDWAGNNRLEKKKRIWRKSGKKCSYCKRPLELYEVTIDHVIPMGKGGARKKMSNLTAACYKCNHEKADKIKI